MKLGVQALLHYTIWVFDQITVIRGPLFVFPWMRGCTTDMNPQTLNLNPRVSVNWTNQDAPKGPALTKGSNWDWLGNEAWYFEGQGT